MPGQEEVAESLLLRRRPDGIPDGLHEAVVEGDVDLYPALGGEESLEVRAWVFREHWYRNRPKGGGRLEMSVDREDVVNSVLDGVSAASPQQQRPARTPPQRGPSLKRAPGPLVPPQRQRATGQTARRTCHP